MLFLSLYSPFYFLLGQPIDKASEMPVAWPTFMLITHQVLVYNWSLCNLQFCKRLPLLASTKKGFPCFILWSNHHLHPNNRYRRTSHTYPRQGTRITDIDPLRADGDHHQDERSSGKMCDGQCRTEDSKMMPPRRAWQQNVATVRCEDQVFTRS